jgi:hypothetical protein
MNNILKRNYYNTGLWIRSYIIVIGNKLYLQPFLALHIYDRNNNANEWEDNNSAYHERIVFFKDLKVIEVAREQKQQQQQKLAEILFYNTEKLYEPQAAVPNETSKLMLVPSLYMSGCKNNMNPKYTSEVIALSLHSTNTCQTSQSTKMAH